jgi:hypothetical protein
MALRRAIKHLVWWVKVRWVRWAAVDQGLDRFRAARRGSGVGQQERRINSADIGQQRP